MDLSNCYRSLVDPPHVPDNLSNIESQVWNVALLGNKNISIELINDEDVSSVKLELKGLGLIKIKNKSKLIHAAVHGGHKVIQEVKAKFPAIEDMNCDNQLFAVYIKAIKQKIFKAENLNAAEKSACKALNDIYNGIQKNNIPWVSVSYNIDILEIIQKELLKVPNIKFKTGTLHNCSGDDETIMLIWNWNGNYPQLLKEDFPEYYYPLLE